MSSDAVPKARLYQESCVPVTLGSSEKSKNTWETMDVCERFTYVALAPFKFILGIIQCIAVLFILLGAQLFTKGGARALFIGEGIFAGKKALKKGLVKAANFATEHTYKDTAIEITHLDNTLQAFILTRPKNQESIGKKQWIVYIPGMRSSIETHHQEVVGLYKANNVHGVICVNPPGVGLSEGSTKSPADFCSAAAAGIRYIKEQHKDESPNITLWGHSLGGASAMVNANDPEFKDFDIQVVLDRTFIRYDKAIEYSPLIFFPCAQLLKKIVKKIFYLDSGAELKKTKRSVVVVASQKDEVIDYHKASAIQIVSNKIRARLVVEFEEHNRTPGVIPDAKATLSKTPEHSFAHTKETINTIMDCFQNYKQDDLSDDERDALDY